MEHAGKTGACKLREGDEAAFHRMHVVSTRLVENDAEIRRRHEVDADALHLLDDLDPLFAETPPRFDALIEIDLRALGPGIPASG